MRLNQGWSKVSLVSGGLDWVGAVKRKGRLIQSIGQGNLLLLMPPPQLLLQVYAICASPGMSCLRLRIRNLKGQQLVGPSRGRSRIRQYGILVDPSSFRLRSGAG